MKKNNQIGKQEDDEGKEIKQFEDLQERFKLQSQTQKQLSYQSTSQLQLFNKIDDEVFEMNNIQNKNSIGIKLGKLILPELPKANDILPKQASKKEQPNYVIGNSYQNIIGLDGQQPYEEKLWRINDDFQKVLSQKKSNQNNMKVEQDKSVLRSKSYALSPQSEQLHQSNNTQFKELSSLLREYDIVYQKYPQNYSSYFNIIQCDLSTIQDKIQCKKDIEDQDTLQIQKQEVYQNKIMNVQQGENYDNSQHKINFKQDNKTVPYIQNDPFALNSIQQNKYNKQNQIIQEGAQQYIKQKQKVHQIQRKNVESISLEKVQNDMRFDEQSVIKNDNIPLKNIQKAQTIQNQNSKQRKENNPYDTIGQKKQNKIHLKNQTLEFDSQFECGNLSYAFMKSQRQYLLVLQNDINTKGFTQWFYFRVENKMLKGKVTFSIINYHKPYSLFNQGMKILVYSKKKRDNQNLGWHRCCYNISYVKNDYRRTSSSTNQSYYTLEFTYDFIEEDDEVFFAYNYPYTYSDLQNYLESIEKDPFKKQFINRKILCRTLAQNRVDLLTITDGSSNYHVSKQTIVISARVHPGETVSSFMIKGLIDFLLEDTIDSSYLRNNFIFKIVPMLNPDGVIHGNYRCSLAGKDLNRQWKKPSKGIFGEIHFLKKLILNTKRLVLFCDLHGHSIKKNIFVYGCHDYSQPSACRELPYIISKIFQPFSYKDCNFKMQMEKQGTARVALWKTLKIPNIFTLESSFCGPSYNDIHFRLQDLENMGKVLCQALMIYFEPSALKQNVLSTNSNLPNDIDGEHSESSKQSSSNLDNYLEKQKQQLASLDNLKTLLNINKQDILKELKQNQELLSMGMDDSDGSDSCPSEDEIENVLKQQITSEMLQKVDKAASPQKNIKRITRKSESVVNKANLIINLSSQRNVILNKTNNTNSPEQPQKYQVQVNRQEISFKSRRSGKEELPLVHPYVSLSPRNNVPQKFRGRSSMHFKNIKPKKDVIVGYSVLTLDNSQNSNNNSYNSNNTNNDSNLINSNLIKTNKNQVNSTLKKNILDNLDSQEEIINIQNTMVYKRNPLYDYYEGIQPKVRAKASEIGILKKNLESEVNNITKNRKSITPNKTSSKKIEQLINGNMNIQITMQNNSNENQNYGYQKNLNQSHNQSHSYIQVTNDEKQSYFPSIKSNSKQIQSTKSNYSTFMSSGVQSYISNNSNANNLKQLNILQRNYSDRLKFDDEMILKGQSTNNSIHNKTNKLTPQNINHITPKNIGNLLQQTINNLAQQNDDNNLTTQTIYSQASQQNNHHTPQNIQNNAIIQNNINTFIDKQTIMYDNQEKYLNPKYSKKFQKQNSIHKQNQSNLLLNNNIINTEPIELTTQNTSNYLFQKLDTEQYIIEENKLQNLTFDKQINERRSSSAKKKKSIGLDSVQNNSKLYQVKSVRNQKFINKASIIQNIQQQNIHNNNSYLNVKARINDNSYDYYKY